MATVSISISPNNIRLKYREKYLTEGVNEKSSGLIGGVYRGFYLAPSAVPDQSIWLVIDPFSPPKGLDVDQFAIYNAENDGGAAYALSIRETSNVSLDLSALPIWTPGVKTVYVYIEASYLVGGATTGVYAASDVNPKIANPYAIILGTITDDFSITNTISFIPDDNGTMVAMYQARTTPQPTKSDDPLYTGGFSAGDRMWGIVDGHERRNFPTKAQKDAMTFAASPYGGQPFATLGSVANTAGRLLLDLTGVSVPALTPAIEGRGGIAATIGQRGGSFLGASGNAKGGDGALCVGGNSVIGSGGYGGDFQGGDGTNGGSAGSVSRGYGTTNDPALDGPIGAIGIGGPGAIGVYGEGGEEASQGGIGVLGAGGASSAGIGGIGGKFIGGSGVPVGSAGVWGAGFGGDGASYPSGPIGVVGTGGTAAAGVYGLGGDNAGSQAASGVHGVGGNSGFSSGGYGGKFTGGSGVVGGAGVFGVGGGVTVPPSPPITGAYGVVGYGGDGKSGVVGIATGANGRGVTGYGIGDGYGLIGLGEGASAALVTIGGADGAGVVGVGNVDGDGSGYGGVFWGSDGIGLRNGGFGAFAKGGDGGPENGGDAFYGLGGDASAANHDGGNGITAHGGDAGVDGYSGVGGEFMGGTGRAPLHLVPKASTPTNGKLGDLYVSTAGKLYVCTVSSPTAPTFVLVGTQV